jgi:hypothetical protein
MGFPVSPTNGQQATVNGVIYTYVAATGVWSVTTNTGANVSANNITSAATITVGTDLEVFGSANVAGNITGDYILGNGALLTGVITSVTNISDGTSNVTVNGTNGDVTVGVDGVGNIAVFTTDGITVTGNIVPAANVTYSLGSESAQWKDLWVSNNTVYINSVPITVVGNTLQVAGQDVLSNDSNVAVDTSGNITAGNLIATANVIITNGVYYANGAPYSSGGGGGGGADDAIVFALALG